MEIRVLVGAMMENVAEGLAGDFVSRLLDAERHMNTTAAVRTYKGVLSGSDWLWLLGC
jgi:uncharacterized protein